jgi:hypothetical protein
MELSALIDQARQYIASNFLIILGAAASGAFGVFVGAWLRGRRESKQAIVAELNSINAAYTLCFSITNRFLLVKGQHVLPMKQRYDEAQREHEIYKKRAALRSPGQDRVIFHLRVDFETMQTINVPTSVLERLVFEKTAIRGRGLGAAVDLIGVVDSLQQAIKARNELILEMRKDSPIPPDKLAEIYLGLTNKDGVTDRRFPNLIEAIARYTDDCIFFARTLADELLAYESRLRRRYAWRYRLRISKMRAVDWSKAQNAGLMPRDEQFADWLQGFQQRPTLLQRLRNLRPGSRATTAK